MAMVWNNAHSCYIQNFVDYCSLSTAVWTLLLTFWWLLCMQNKPASPEHSWSSWIPNTAWPLLSTFLSCLSCTCEITDSQNISLKLAAGIAVDINYTGFQTNQQKMTH
jgi:hypothetical protein